MFYKPEFAAAHLTSIIVSVLLMLACWKRPQLGRVLFAVLFGWACVVNWTTVVTRPEAYLEYGPLAVLDLYTTLIQGPFSALVFPVVGAIASCQGLIALGMLVGRMPAKVAITGAIVFLVAIAPLGVGSAFPATLLMAAGMLFLLRGDALRAPIWSSARDRWRRRSSREWREQSGERADAHEPSERSRIDAFLGSKRIALVGASNDPTHFSRMVMRELIAHGLQVIPVHPTAQLIEGETVFAHVAEIEPKVEGALLMVPALVSAEVVEECAAAGITQVWLHRGVGTGAVSERAIAVARQHNLSLIAGRCPLMFLGEHPAAIHRMHAGVERLLRRYPRQVTPA